MLTSLAQLILILRLGHHHHHSSTLHNTPDRDMDITSDLRAELLKLGISLSQARAAIAAGNTTVEAAMDWYYE